MGSRKPPFGTGIHLTFPIRAPGRSLDRSRDHAGFHGIQFEQGIACPNGLAKERDGGGSAHDFFYFPGNCVPSAGPIFRCLQQQMREGATCEISVATSAAQQEAGSHAAAAACHATAAASCGQLRWRWPRSCAEDRPPLGEGAELDAKTKPVLLSFSFFFKF